MATQLPYGAAEIVAMRSNGKRPADMVLVSLVGSLRETNPVVIAKAERSYDWRWLIGLSVAVVVTTETPNTAKIIKAIEAAKPATLAVWFADKQDGLNIAMQGYHPSTKTGRRIGIRQRATWAGLGTDKPAADCLLLIAGQVKREAMANAGRFDPALIAMAHAGYRRIFGAAWEALA